MLKDTAYRSEGSSSPNIKRIWHYTCNVCSCFLSWPSDDLWTVCPTYSWVLKNCYRTQTLLVSPFLPNGLTCVPHVSLCLPLPQCQDHQEHRLHQPGADGRAVEEEVWEGEGEEQNSEGKHPEAGDWAQPLEKRWDTWSVSWPTVFQLRPRFSCVTSAPLCWNYKQKCLILMLLILCPLRRLIPPLRRERTWDGADHGRRGDPFREGGGASHLGQRHLLHCCPHFRGGAAEVRGGDPQAVQAAGWQGLNIRIQWTLFACTLSNYTSRALCKCYFLWWKTDSHVIMDLWL